MTPPPVPAAVAPRRRASPSAVAALAALALGSNLTALRNGFVFDDLVNVLRNPWALRPGTVWNAFTHNLAAFDPTLDATYYRPVMHLVLAACQAVGGTTPWLFHLVNLVVHAATTLGVYLVALEWCGTGEAAGPAPGSDAAAVRAAWIGAALFAVHPIHAEAVAWISGIVDLSCAALFVWAFLAATHGGRPAIRRCAAPALFLLALLSKEPAVMLPPVVALALLARGDGRDPARRRRAVATVAGLGASIAVYLPLRLHALGGLMRGPPRVRVDAATGVATALGLLGEHARMMLAPVHQSAIHDFRVVPSLLDPPALLGAGVLAGVVALAWRGRRRPGVLVGCAFLLLPLIPALYAPALSEGLAAERYTYLPTAGLALLVAEGVRVVTARSRAATRVVLASAAAILAVAAAATLRRDSVWRDDVTLWTDAVRKVPRSGAAHEYLGHALLVDGRPEDAVSELTTALRLDPSRRDAHVNLASALVAVHRPEEAIREAEEGVRLRSTLPEAHAVLGYAFASSGRFAEAIGPYEHALALDPSQASTHGLLGIAYAMTGRTGAAAAQFRDAIRLAPADPVYRHDLDVLEASSPGR